MEVFWWDSMLKHQSRLPMSIIKKHNCIFIFFFLSQLQSICCYATRTNRQRNNSLNVTLLSKLNRTFLKP